MSFARLLCATLILSLIQLLWAAGFNPEIFELSVSPDGRYLIETNDRGGVRVVDLNRLQSPFNASLVWEFNIGGLGTKVRFHPYKSRVLLLARLSKQRLRILIDDLPSKSKEELIDSTIDDARAADFGPGDTIVVVNEKEVVIWNYLLKSVLAASPLKAPSTVTSLSASEKHFVIGFEDGMAESWSLEPLAMQYRWKASPALITEATYTAPDAVAFSTASQTTIWRENSGQWRIDRALDNVAGRLVMSDSSERFIAKVGGTNTTVFESLSGNTSYKIKSTRPGLVGPAVVLSDRKLIATASTTGACSTRNGSMLIHASTGVPILEIKANSEQRLVKGMPRRFCAPRYGAILLSCGADALVGDEVVPAFVAVLQYANARREIVGEPSASLIKTTIAARTGGAKDTLKHEQLSQLIDLWKIQRELIARRVALAQIEANMRVEKAQPSLVSQLKVIASQDPEDYRAFELLIKAFTGDEHEQARAKATFRSMFRFDTVFQEDRFGCIENFPHGEP